MSEISRTVLEMQLFSRDDLCFIAFTAFEMLSTLISLTLNMFANLKCSPIMFLLDKINERMKKVYKKFMEPFLVNAFALFTSAPET